MCSGERRGGVIKIPSFDIWRHQTSAFRVVFITALACLCREVLIKKYPLALTHRKVGFVDRHTRFPVWFSFCRALCWHRGRGVIDYLFNETVTP